MGRTESMSPTVLLVDDEVSILDILATWLEDAGYNTCTASNGYDGLVALRSLSPDLVITGILMPQINGYELCKMVRELTPAPIMFLSGLTMESDKNTGFRVGGNDYLTKPVSMNVFLQHVSNLIDNRGQQSPLQSIRILR